MWFLYQLMSTPLVKSAPEYLEVENGQAVNSRLAWSGSLAGSCAGDVCTTRLYGGLSSTRSAFISSSLSALARFSNMCDDEFSKADSWLLGRIQVSKGNRGAYGARVTKLSFSATTRTPLSMSCRMASQKTQRSL